MRKRLFQVDAFTDKVFAGNPAGVCVMDEAAPDEWMQNVAAEMNLSETAYLYPEKDGYNLRWFTPAVEVDQCGHATLASAHILWDQKYAEHDREIRFYTRSGLLVARRQNDWIQLSFPSLPAEPADPPETLKTALGAELLHVAKNDFAYLVEVESEQTLRNLLPDFSALAKLPVLMGAIVTSRSSDDRYDFVSRVFAPVAGINEDPVTGSAFCCLGPYWQKRLGKSEFFAYQASKRGGEARVKVERDRVYISGQAVTVFEIRVV